MAGATKVDTIYAVVLFIEENTVDIVLNSWIYTDNCGDLYTYWPTKNAPACAKNLIQHDANWESNKINYYVTFNRNIT